jgi:hypothetical protein
MSERKKNQKKEMIAFISQSSLRYSFSKDEITLQIWLLFR